MPDNLHNRAYACLMASDPDKKVALGVSLARDWRAGNLTLDSDSPVAAIAAAGMPDRLKLVEARELPRRKPATLEGRATLIHALVHIEFNAINLGWDAIYRFRGQPRAFYDDWVRVAAEETYHFTLLRDHLRELGFEYGDWPGHNGLWAMAVKSAADLMVRMALVPRCLEARGLDVTPTIRAKLVDNGDLRAGEILDLILRDEIGHVAIGDRWFRHECAARGLEPEATYWRLIDEYMPGGLRGPFHLAARRQAGFSEAELSYLEGVG